MGDYQTEADLSPENLLLLILPYNSVSAHHASLSQSLSIYYQLSLVLHHLSPQMFHTILNSQSLFLLPLLLLPFHDLTLELLPHKLNSPKNTHFSPFLNILLLLHLLTSHFLLLPHYLALHPLLSHSLVPPPFLFAHLSQPL